MIEIFKVVLDPGHGGTKDAGEAPFRSAWNNARSGTGQLEKNLVFDFAKEIEAELKNDAETEVKLTRTSKDKNPTLDDRRALANGAHLFLSLHFNESTDPKRFGTRSFLHLLHSPASRRLAELIQHYVGLVTGNDLGVGVEAIPHLLEPHLEQLLTLPSKDEKKDEKHASRAAQEAKEFAEEAKKRAEQAKELAKQALCLVELDYLTREKLPEFGQANYNVIVAKAVCEAIREFKRHKVPDKEASRFAEEVQRFSKAELEKARSFEDGYAAEREQRGFPPAVLRGFVVPPEDAKKGLYTGIEVKGIGEPKKFIEEWRRRRQRKVERPAGPGPEKRIGLENRLPFNFLLKGAAFGRAVCLIQTTGEDHSGRKGSWSGTGFLVSPNILLTNHHVINSIPVARQAVCKFDYAVDEKDELPATTQTTLDPDRLFVTSPYQAAMLEGGKGQGGHKGLDYTFVWMKIDEAENKRLGHIPLLRSSFLVDTGDCANIIQHALGGLKQVSLQANQIVDVHEAVLHYLADTEEGSSGSPVFTNDWFLIALHHSSVFNQYQRKAAYSTETPSILNEGIKIAAIAADLERRLEGSERRQVELALSCFVGTDSLAGYFGMLGRRPVSRQGAPASKESIAAECNVELVKELYNEETSDLDIAFWNVGAMDQSFKERSRRLEEFIADLNCDVWVFLGTSKDNIQALSKNLNDNWGMKFENRAFLVHHEQGDETSIILMYNEKTCSLDEAAVREGSALIRCLNPNGEVDGTAVILRYLNIPQKGQTDSESSELDPHIREELDYALKKDEDVLIGGYFDSKPLFHPNALDRLPGERLAAAGTGRKGALLFVQGCAGRTCKLILSPDLGAASGAVGLVETAHGRASLAPLEDYSRTKPLLVRLCLDRTQNPGHKPFDLKVKEKGKGRKKPPKLPDPPIDAPPEDEIDELAQKIAALLRAKWSANFKK